MKGQVIWTHLATSIQPFDQLKPMRPFNNGLAAYYDYVKRKWGYINKEGKIMIPAVLEEAKDFSEGLAAVKRDGKWGYINTKGLMSISNIFTKRARKTSLPDELSCIRTSRKTMPVILIPWEKYVPLISILLFLI